MKLGLWLLVAAVAFLWFNHARKQRRVTRQKAQDDRQARDAAGTAAGGAGRPPGTGQLESIVACAHCGLHVPASDASISEAGKSFCSEAHRRLHPPA